jgi:hypothetical protein
MSTYRENFPSVVEQVMANTEDVNMLHPDDIEFLADSSESEGAYTDEYNKNIKTTTNTNNTWFYTKEARK